jgi:hypothetical protein
MYRRTATALIALTTTAGLVAGCGGSSSGGSEAHGTPAATTTAAPVALTGAAAKLATAVSRLSDASTLTTSLKLGATADQLMAFGRAQSDDSRLTADQARKIADAALTITVAAPAGQTLGDITGLSKSGAANIALVEGGQTWVNFRFVDKVLYLQADLEDLLTALGKQKTYRQIERGRSKYPFLDKALDGGWLSLPLSALTQSGATSALPTPDAAQARSFIDSLKSLLTSDVTVTRKSGRHDDTYTLTTNLRKISADLMAKFRAVPGAADALGADDLSKVPDRDVSLVATVRKGKLTGLSFDLAQLAKVQKPALPIRMTFKASHRGIAAPAGATPVDLTALYGLVYGGTAAS